VKIRRQYGNLRREGMEASFLRKVSIIRIDGWLDGAEVETTRHVLLQVGVGFRTSESLGPVCEFSEDPPKSPYKNSRFGSKTIFRRVGSQRS
jgi:hypothetical protein